MIHEDLMQLQIIYDTYPFIITFNYTDTLAAPDFLQCTEYRAELQQCHGFNKTLRHSQQIMTFLLRETLL